VIDQQWIRRTVAVAACLVAACILSSCNTPTTPSSTAPFDRQDLRAGTGAEAVAGKVLTVNYTGWLYDRSKPEQKGVVFDTSLGRGTFSFTLGAGQVIQGWELGLVGLRVGGLRRLVIPPSMAYGAARTYAIPAYSTLVFEVELLDVQDPASSSSSAGS
jgi:FKBP-type peptidyl-prolyl cis-trans isomerase